MKGLFAYLLLSLGVAHADETRRLVTHFDTVIAELQTADTGGLTPIARAARTRLIEALGAYRDARRFPRNPDFAKPTPYFIDGQGTRCAMAHLIEISGHSKLVEAVATTRNNAYIKDLADDPTLLAWLDAHGLTVAEAARIQPTYFCLDGAGRHCVLANGGDEALYRATVTDTSPDMETVEINEIIGRPAQATLAVGMPIPVELQSIAAMPIGTSMLGLIEAGVFVPTHIIEGDEARSVSFPYESNSDEPRDAPNVPIDVLIQAVNSGNCRAALIAYDPVFDLPRCRGESSDDCSQRPGNDSPLLAVLLLGAVGWRRYL